MTTSYFDWLVDKVHDKDHDTYIYQKLLSHLFKEEFYACLKRDDNRIEDGLELRARFIYENCFDEYSDCIDAPTYCSVLEMLVALSIRWENEIMYDPNFGDRTSKWFWIMLDNLGLSDFTDDKYDPFEIDYILNVWLERDYKRSGVGGLFYTNNPKINMPKTEIWYQMNYFIDEFLS